MTAFDYDCMQKKRIARGAMHRKCGSKSRKCSLPSDYLTPKQLKELNGKVNTYYMNKPMEWKVFKTMSEQLQVEYIDHLVSEYAVGKSALAKMFGVCRNYVDEYLKKLPLKSEFKRGNHQSPEQKALWAAFIGEVPVVDMNDENAVGGSEMAVTTEFAPAESNDVEAELANTETFEKLVKTAALKNDHKPCSDGDCEKEQHKKMQMKKFSLVFEGVVDADAIANSIRSIVGRGSVGVVKIECELTC